MKIVVLVVAFGFCLCENGNDGRSSQFYEISSLVYISEKMGALEEKVANMAVKISSLETKLQGTEKQDLETRSLTGGPPQVAFSAALRDTGAGDIGAFNAPTPLKYKKVFSNTGSCYNPATGIFTATVKGMYFFRFSMFNNLAQTPNSVVQLLKNGERLVSVWDTSGSDSHDMGSNAVVIPLNKGDTVYVELQANRLLYDDYLFNYNTFCGFLLFTM